MWLALSAIPPIAAEVCKPYIVAPLIYYVPARSLWFETGRACPRATANRRPPSPTSAPEYSRPAMAQPRTTHSTQGGPVIASLQFGRTSGTSLPTTPGHPLKSPLTGQPSGLMYETWSVDGLDLPSLEGVRYVLARPVAQQPTGRLSGWLPKTSPTGEVEATSRPPNRREVATGSPEGWSNRGQTPQPAASGEPMVVIEPGNHTLRRP